MISICHNTIDQASLDGIRHFVERFGIPVEINPPGKSDIVISYGNCARGGDFTIRVAEHLIRDEFCGEVLSRSGSAFICEVPENIDVSDEIIAYYQKNADYFPCIARKAKEVHIGVDIFRETGSILSGHLEGIHASLEKETKRKIATRPSMDFLEFLLFDSILAGCRELNIPLVQKSFWPDAKPFAVCLTHDVDELMKTYQWISRPFRYLSRRDIAGVKNQVSSLAEKIRGFEPYYTYDDIIQIEQNMGAKSTYYILKESGKANLRSKTTWYLYGRNRSLKNPKVKKLIRQLRENGDEVAVHGSYFSFNDPKLLKEEVRELGELTQEEILGTRQHNLNLEIPSTWRFQEDAGLKYDASLGFHEMPGFRWGTSFPFHPVIPGRPDPILEIPLIIMDICLESSKAPERDCLRIAEEVLRFNGALTLLWHPPVFNEREYPGLRTTYISLTNYCKDRGAWIARACELYKWIDQRNVRSFQTTFDPDGKVLHIFADGNETEQYFTLYLPVGMTCSIPSGNAKIIKNAGNIVFIKTLLSGNDGEVTVKLT